MNESQGQIKKPRSFVTLTLIDDLFTNVLPDIKISSLLVNDISDHLPGFTIYHNNHNKVYDI